MKKTTDYTDYTDEERMDQSVLIREICGFISQ